MNFRFNAWLETELTDLDNSVPTNTVSLPNDAFQRSFASIDKAQRTLLELKHAHNRQVPIFQLPVEILAEICLYARDAWPYMAPARTLYSEFLFHRSSWMHIGEVCRRFRDIVEEHPTLWTRLSDDAAPTWGYFAMVALGYVSFSGKSISLSLRPGVREQKVLKDLFLRLECPVRELRLHGAIPHQNVAETLKIILSNRNLESLRALHLDLAVSNDMRLLITIERGSFRSLNELSMVGIVVNFDSTIYDGLERLTLSALAITQRQDAERLQVLLTRMNGLKYLKLDRPKIAPDAVLPFTLPPNLRTFEFTTTSAFDFLQSVSPSRQVSLSIQRSAPPRDNTDERVWSTIFSRWLGSDLRPTAASIRISYNTVALDAEFRFWRLLSSALSQSRPDVTVKRYIDETYTLSELLHEVCLADITNLEVDIESVLREDFTEGLRDLTDAMPNLHTLCSTESYLANIFRTPSDTDGLCKLHTLRVRQSSTYRTAKEYVKEEVRALVAWLRHRGDANCPVHTLLVPARVAHGLDEEGFAEWRSLASVVRFV